MEAAPITARMEVVRTPSCSSTAISPSTMTIQRTSEAMKPCSVASLAPGRCSRSSARRVNLAAHPDAHSVKTRMTPASARLTASCPAASKKLRQLSAPPSISACTPERIVSIGAGGGIWSGRGVAAMGTPS